MLERSCRGSGSISDFFITAQRNPSRSRFRSHRYPSCTIALSLSLAAEQKASPAGAGGPGNPENKKVRVAQPTCFPLAGSCPSVKTTGIGECQRGGLPILLVLELLGKSVG